MTYSHLTLHALELLVSLGITHTEQSQKQKVLVDIDIRFDEPPKGYLTDNITDTYCYDELTQQITKHVASKAFHLIEHMAYAIYQITKNFIETSASISVRITKNPIMGTVIKGVSAYYGDKNFS